MQYNAYLQYKMPTLLAIILVLAYSKNFELADILQDFVQLDLVLKTFMKIHG